MSHTLPDALRAPITDLPSAKAWLRTLVAADMSFHLEDNPAEITMGATGAPLFCRKDVPLIRERVRQLYALDWGPRAGLGMCYCPIGYLLVLEPFNSVNQAHGYEVGAVVERAEGDLTIIDRSHCASYEYGTPGCFHLYREPLDGTPALLCACDTFDEANTAMEKELA